MTNALILIDFLSKLALRMAEGFAVLRKAQAEGRDVTKEELDAAGAQYDAKREDVLAHADDGPTPDNG